MGSAAHTMASVLLKPRRARRGGSGEWVAARRVVSKSSQGSRRSSGSRATLVHELRTPLNAILAWAQILGPDAGRAELEQGLQSIARSARRQARLLERLSSVSTQGGVDGVDGHEDDDDAEEEARAEPLPDLAGVRVLVVDDDEAARIATTRIVIAAGAAGWQVTSASEAIDCLHRRTFDAIVSDVTMPEMDGYGFIAAVRADRSRRVRLMPAIALSAVTSATARRHAYRAGFQLHLAKPVDAVELCLAIANLVTLARAGSTARTTAPF